MIWLNAWLIGIPIAALLTATIYSIVDSGTNGFPTNWDLILVGQVLLLAVAWPAVLGVILLALAMMALSRLGGK